LHYLSGRMEWTLYMLLFFAAFFYGSVGHGGGSSYILLLTLFNYAPQQIRPTALILNIFIAFIAFISYQKKCKFPYKLFFTIILFSMPAAYIGGFILIDTNLYKKILGVLLIFPVIRLFNLFRIPEKKIIDTSFWFIGCLGGGIGFFSGLIGIGGGIILSPIILMLGWCKVKETAALSALFIVCNSMAGFFGVKGWGMDFGQEFYMFLIVTIIGGSMGAYLGAFRWNLQTIKYILGFVLSIAIIKLIWI